MILNVIMIFAACCAACAWLVTWAKLDEQKKLTQKERERCWDEISRAATIEKEKDAEIEKWQQEAKRYCFYFENAREGNKALQDHLSSLICPRNDHVWKDGVCAKCGRVK